MAVDPGIALSVRPPQVRSPLESMQRAISIADMVAGLQQRQQEARYRAEEEPVRRAELAAHRRKLEDDTALTEAFKQTVKYNPDVDDLEYDLQAATNLLTSKNRADLLPRYVSEMNTERAAYTHQWLQRAEPLANATENFLALPEEQRAEHWLPYRRVAGQLDPGAKALGNQYTPEIVPKLEQFVAKRNAFISRAEKIKAQAEAEKAKAELAKMRAETSRITKEAQSSQERIDTAFELFKTTGAVAKDATLEGLSEEKRRELFVAAGIPVPAERVKSEATIEREVIEQAYAEKNKLDPAKLTASQKVAARQWSEKLSPEKKTDMQILMGLYRSNKPEDRKLFEALRNIESGPSVTDKRTIISTAISAALEVDSVTGEKSFNPEQFEQVRKLYTPLWPEMPGLPQIEAMQSPAAAGDTRPWYARVGAGIKGILTPTPPSAKPSPTRPALPKPSKPGEIASDDVLEQYLQANGGDVAKAEKALKDAGYRE